MIIRDDTADESDTAERRPPAPEVKPNFYKELAERLQLGLKLRKEDVLINLVEVQKENWSFGNSVAQYVSR